MRVILFPQPEVIRLYSCLVTSIWCRAKGFVQILISGYVVMFKVRHFLCLPLYVKYCFETTWGQLGLHVAGRECLQCAPNKNKLGRP
jgi:hypothetical protein